MVIGGGHLYGQLLPRADSLYLTRIDLVVAGDTRFPAFDEGDWVRTESDPHQPDEKNPHPYPPLNALPSQGLNIINVVIVLWVLMKGGLSPGVTLIYAPHPLILLMAWIINRLFMQPSHIFPIHLGHLLNFCCLK